MVCKLAGSAAIETPYEDPCSHRLLETFDMCLIFHILYWYLITHYGDSTVLANPVWYARPIFY